MIKKPEFLDIWKINSSTDGVVVNVNEDEINLFCKDSITKKTYFMIEKLIKTKDDEIKYKIFNDSYKFIGKSKLIDILFEVKND